jgi:hypothetical protein
VLAPLGRALSDRSSSDWVVRETRIGRNDADWGKKSDRGIQASGKVWGKVVAWFGDKIHSLVDAPDEWPLAWTVTKASTADITEALQLLAQLQAKHPLALKAARTLTADRGCTATSFVQSLWDDDGVKPVIAI